MSGFTFLTKEQCFGDKQGNGQLDILKKRGVKAEVTDFAILLGKKTYLSDYWLKNNVDTEAATILEGKRPFYELINSSSIGVRPVFEFSDKESIPTNGEGIKEADDGVLEIEYGYYPQKAASLEMQDELEKAYNNGNIILARNKYTTASKNYYEYNYKGKKYVRVEAVCTQDRYFDNKFKLSNGKEYERGDNVWVEVQPVKWLVDKEAHLAVAEKVIFSGVPFSKEKEYRTEDFDKTEVKKIMDKYLSRDMFQEMSREEKTTKRNTNPYNLDFARVSEEDIIREAIKANVSVFLHGKPGSGKSDRVKQLDPDFIELNLSHLDPELLDGLAGEKEGREVHIKPPWLEELEGKCKEEPEKIHILFLEELTNASPMMQSKAYGIALDKKVAGRWKLPENARVVAAGNELEDSLAANEIAEPLYDRFAHVNIETDAESWLEWAVTPEESYERINYEKEDKSRPKIHPAIYGYISYKGDEVLRTPYNSEHPEPHADPRRWKMASDMLYASNNPETLRAIVGEDLTRDFIEFCRMPRITIEDIINGNYTKEDLDMDLGEKLATISGLIRVDSTNMPKVREFVKKLGPEMCRKFEVQWAHGDEERLEQLQEIRMEEEEKENKEHSSEEAKEYGENGALTFKRIEMDYQENLSKHEDKSK